MKNKTQVFVHPELGEIKGFMKEGEPWFLAGDACRALGIKNSNHAISAIAERYKIAGIEGVGISYTLVETKGGKQRVTIIPEPFLYELIFNSRKQKAVKFRSWVTTEVLPALRKHGEYRMEGKMIRRKETDSIKALVEYAMEHGSTNSKRYYALITKETNKTLGIEPGNRDALSVDELERIAIVESVIDRTIRKAIEQGLPYKDVYQVVKSKINTIGLEL